MRARFAVWCALALVGFPCVAAAQADVPPGGTAPAPSDAAPPQGPATASPDAAPPATVPGALPHPHSAVMERILRDESGRDLNGHLFTPSQYVITPFSVTYFGSAAEYGYANLSGQKIDVLGRTIGKDHYPVAAYGSVLNFSARILDALALRLDALGYVFSGVTTPAALVAGVAVSYSVNAGLTLGTELFRGFRGAITLDASYVPALNLTPLESLTASIATGSIVSRQLFFTSSVAKFRPGISLAWAPLPLLGVIAEARYVRLKTVKEGQETVKLDQWEVDALVDLDFNTVSPVPISLYAVYRNSTPWRQPTNRITDLGGGLFYSGRVNVAVGLEAVWQHFQLRSSTPADAVIMDLGLRYFW